MAVFESKKPHKVTLDDTTPLTCTIETAQNAGDHIEYTVRVQRGPVSENNWTITKRYSDFDALDTSLKLAGIELPLPPKKVFGNKEREFIAERQQGLQNYLQTLLSHPILANSLTVKKFLDPNNYSMNLQELALQQISMFFRSEPKWEVAEPLPDMGCRLRKQYFLIKNKDEPKAKFILSWCQFGPDKFLPDKDLLYMMKLIPTFQHPHLYPVSFASCNENSGIAVRPFCEKGTLRDLICKARPKGSYVKKYGKSKQSQGCSLQIVKLLGRQILETLKFLHDKGLPYGGHLHAGNVIVEENQVKLMDHENWLLGLPSPLRCYYTQYKKIQSMESVDVYSFGHLLFEMTFGEQLAVPSWDRFPEALPFELRSAMQSILSTQACKNGMPSIQDLLAHPLFDDVVVVLPEKPVLKIPSKVKESVREARAATEKRLKEEQKVINQYKRLSKAQAFHMSEDEKKKRRSKLKKQKNGKENGDVSFDTSASSNASSVTSPTSADAPTSPPTPVAPPTAPVPPPPPPSQNISASNGGPPGSASGNRGALLSSINNFKKGGLKKSETVDKSGPRI